MKLYFSRNPNPRLAVAAARHLGAPVTYEFAAPFAAEHEARFRALNPNRLLPILETQEGSLWEADAIACRLSFDCGSDFWRKGAAEPEMIRWLSWGKGNFVAACDMVHFERGTKQRYALGPLNPKLVAKGLNDFRKAAELLDNTLASRAWLAGDSVSFADFRMATFLPFNDVARLPVEEFPNILRWYAQLEALPAWRDPFAGLEAPLLPPAPRVD